MPDSYPFNNGNMSLEITNFVFDVSLGDHFSVQAWYAGSPNGQLILEGRNGVNPGDFLPVGGPNYSVTITGGGVYLLEYPNCCFREARLHWVPTGSSSGILNALALVKRTY